MSNLSAKTRAANTARAQWESKVTYLTPEGWVPGVSVNVSAERTKGKKGLSFSYLRHVRNNETGSEWVDVKDKLGNICSFRPSEVTLKIIKPKRKYTRRK